MKSIWVVALCFLAGFSPSHAQQNHKLDSLLVALRSAEDTTRANILIALAREARFSDPEESENYAKEALGLSEKHGFLQGQAKAKKELCRSFAEKGDYATAVKLALEALRSFESAGDKSAVRDMYTSLGIINRYQKNYQRSLEFFQNALDVTKELGERKALAGIYGNMGNVYHDLKEYEQAKESHLRSLKIDSEFNYLEGVAVTYINLGKLENANGNPNEALSYYTKSVEINQDLGNIRNMALGYTNISDSYLEMRNLEKALYFANQSKEFAERNQSLGLKKGALERLVNVHELLGNYSTALEYSKSLEQVTDSIFNQEQSKQIAELQTKYETEKKEQQIASQDKEIGLLEGKKAADRRLRIALISLAAVLLVLAGFIFSRYRLKRNSEKILRKQHEEITDKNAAIAVMNQELERKALRAQMDPHFIFNSLNSIQHFITTNDKTSALKYLSKFSKLIRQVLENSVNHQVPIADEIKLLEHYIQLEALRFDQKFEHRIEIDENLDIYETEIPFLLIQPYVENAIIHGLNHKTEKGHLKVRLQDQEKHILCTVEDDGVGREKAAELKKQQHHISRGMSVTSRRLELLNCNKKNKTSVKVMDLYDHHDQVTGTKVEIRIPIDLN